jgi:hypothetical protein
VQEIRGLNTELRVWVRTAAWVECSLKAEEEATPLLGAGERVDVAMPQRVVDGPADVAMRLLGADGPADAAMRRLGADGPADVAMRLLGADGPADVATRRLGADAVIRSVHVPMAVGEVADPARVRRLCLTPFSRSSRSRR